MKTSIKSDIEHIHNDKLHFFVKDIEHQNIDICGLQEVRRFGVGKEIFDNYEFYWSGIEKGPSKYGVGILLKKGFLSDVQIFNISERLIYLVGYINNIKYIFFSCYAPTEVSDTLIKTDFYESLHSVFSKFKNNSNIIVFGDFNARIGVFKSYQHKIRGQYIMGDTNDNGNSLLNFCYSNDLCIANSFFEKNTYDTFFFPGSNKGVTLDYCLVSLNLKSNIVDCGVDEVRDFGDVISDHMPVFMEIRLNHNIELAKGFKFSNKKKSLDFSVLKNDDKYRKKINIEVLKRISNVDDINLENFIDICNQVSNKCLPKRSNNKCNSIWFKSDSKINDLLLSRRLAQLDWRNDKDNISKKIEYQNSKKTTRKFLRIIKSNFFKNKSIMMVDSYNKNNMKLFYQYAKNFIPRKVIRVPDFILKLDGNMTKSIYESNERIKEHLSMLLNQKSVISENISELLPNQNLFIFELNDYFSIDELEIAFRDMKNDRAVGVDNIPIEFFKYMGCTQTKNLILFFFNKCLIEGTVPNIMKDATIKMIFKKGDINDLNNYRGISLLSHLGKLLERLIYNRLNKFSEKNNWVPNSQNGFRNKRSTVDSIFISNMISSLCKENNLHVYKIYMDLVKAYDKVNHEILWTILSKLGVPNVFLGLIKSLYYDVNVYVNGNINESFKFENGLKQGSILSPLLFNIFFGIIIKVINDKINNMGIKLIFNDDINIFEVPNIKKNDNDKVKQFTIWNMLFADDTLIFSNSKEELQKLIDIFVEIISAFGLELSKEKSEILITNTKLTNDINCTFKFGSYDFKNTKCFRYLGSVENVEVNFDNEIQMRINKANHAFKLNELAIFKNKELPLNIILANFKIMILSVLLYACEVWCLSKNQVKILERVQCTLLKRIFKCHNYEDKISYLDILMLCEKYGIKMVPIEHLIIKRRLFYLGNILRRNEDDLCFKILHSDIKDGRRSRGNNKNYRSIIKEDLKRLHIPYQNIKNSVKSEKEWECLVINKLECVFRNFCLTKKSDTFYDDSNITKKGLSLKMNTITQLKKKKIFIDYSTNRGRKDNLFDDDLGVDLQSLYDI